MRIGLLMPPRVWKCLLAVGMLFCLGAQAAEKRNLADIRNALWEDSDDVSLQEMLAALREAGDKNLSISRLTLFFAKLAAERMPTPWGISSGFLMRFRRSLTRKGTFSPRLLTLGCE
jgi:hypothetical protein